jgi:hypothetical protein
VKLPLSAIAAKVWSSSGSIRRGIGCPRITLTDPLY